MGQTQFNPRRFRLFDALAEPQRLMLQQLTTLSSIPRHHRIYSVGDTPPRFGWRYTMTMTVTLIPSEERLLLERMRAEWIEMPGMRLTAAQAARLWALDHTVCDRALGVLVQSRFLSKTPRGAYLRGE